MSVSDARSTGFRGSASSEIILSTRNPRALGPGVSPVYLNDSTLIFGNPARPFLRRRRITSGRLVGSGARRLNLGGWLHGHGVGMLVNNWFCRARLGRLRGDLNIRFPRLSGLCGLGQTGGSDILEELRRSI